MSGKRVPLADLLASACPGSFQATGWSWDDKQTELDARICCCCDKPGHYQAQFEDHLRQVGRIERDIIMGHDGIVWDGHHRIVAARRLGFHDIPVRVMERRP